MTDKEQQFVTACRATSLSDENRAQWEQYCHLTSAAAKTAYAESVIDEWNRILAGSPSGKPPPDGRSKDWYKEIPRGQSNPIHAAMQKICDDDLKAQEKDPTGRSAKDGGAKLDAGKPRLGLVLGGFANALIEVGKVGTLGAAKYSDNGWMTVPNAKERYTDAELRHCLKRLAGEIYDPEWGLLHLAHNAWNSLALLELELRRIKTEKGETIPEGTTFEKGFAMVPNEGLKFVIKGGLPKCEALSGFTPIDPTVPDKFKTNQPEKKGGEKEMVKKAKCAAKGGAVKPAAKPAAKAAMPMMPAKKMAKPAKK